MKVKGSHRQILHSIVPQDVAEYLQGKGWQEKGHLCDENSTIWQWRESGCLYREIVLPMDRNVGYYDFRMADVLEILAEVEERSQVKILRDLIAEVPNLEIEAVAIAIPEDLRSEPVTLMGIVVEKLWKFYTCFPEGDRESAARAYHEQLPVRVRGDLIKRQGKFWLQNPQEFTIDEEGME
ncbi:hypothetical protein [Phormidium sp. CCY1219]|uniref:hypothetical protein n=1 Tax=Phormidium sp. CCY1219 TaxID=2886104 RepID=UPI002D1E7C5F|nr:hypothetical protein [Phormidium sp. CCY1219]MEB3827320.1 hypothetical protein [Phormidium sp. CCY1219]